MPLISSQWLAALASRFSPRTTRHGQIAMLMLPVAVFAQMIWRHAVDIPRDDDTFSILPFLLRWEDASGWGQRLSLLFEQYYSHRIVFTKVAALGVNLVAGYCDFLALQALGWLSWLGLTALILRNSEPVRHAPWLGLPVMLILMQPQGATNFLIAMQAVQNLGVLLLAFGSLALCLRPGRVSFACSLLLASLAPLASVNGLLVFPAAVLGLVLHRLSLRALTFASAGATVSLLFFWGYEPAAGNFDFVEFCLNAAVMAGAPLRLGSLGVGLVTLSGGALLLAAAGLLATAWRRPPSALTLFLLFALLSVAMAARGRIGWGSAYMEQDRYRVYGLLTLALLYLLLLDVGPVTRRRLAGMTAAAAAACFNLLSYASYLPQVTTQFRWTLAMAINHQLGRSYCKCTTELWPEAEFYWRSSLARGLIRPPTPLSTADIDFINHLEKNPSIAHPGFAATLSSAYCGYGLKPVGGHAYAPVEFAVLMHEGHPLALPVDILRTRFADVPKRWSFYSDRFEILLPEKLHQTGSHALYGLVRQPHGQLAVLWRTGVTLP